MQKKKKLILLLLIVIPTAIFLSLLVTDVKADEYIPENSVMNPNNNWHWNVSEGDLLIYELDASIKSSDGTAFASKSISIYNITGFQNITTNYMGDGQAMSIVNVTSLYGDENGDLHPVDGKEFGIAMFGYNNSHPYPEKYGGIGGFIIPMLLPINDTSIEVDIMADILNKTLLYPAYTRGDSIALDEKGYDIGTNKIWFRNSTEGHFLNVTYYDNGTLDEGHTQYSFFQMGSTINVTYKLKRVFDYNVTDEIEWGVNEGETYYYGYSIGEEFNETKVDIVGFNYSLIEVEAIGEKKIVFQNVLANISYFDWKTQEYVLLMENETIGTANNFYPFYFDIDDGGEEGGPMITSTVLPNNTKIEDLEYFFNNDTIKFFRFDTVYYSEKNDLVTVEMVRDDSILHSKFVFDNNTGLIELETFEGYVDEDERIDDIIFRKNTTTTDQFIVSENLYSRLVDYANVNINFSYNIPGNIELYWSVLPSCPLGNNSIPYEIPDMPLYIDVYVDNLLAVDPFKSNMTINYDPSKLGEVPVHALNFYFFNMTSQEWEVHTNVTFSSGKIVANLTLAPYYAVGTNMTSLVEWSVDVNDNLYIAEMGLLARARIDVINITEVHLSGDDGPPILVGQPAKQQFSTLYGYFDVWNDTTEKWENEGYEAIGAANNYWPLLVEGMFPFIFPIGTTGYDFKPLFNFFPGFDEKIYGTNFVHLRNTTAGYTSRINISSSTGHLLSFMFWNPGLLPEDWQLEASYYAMNKTSLSIGNFEDIPMYSFLVDDWKMSSNLTTTESLDIFWALLPHNPTPVPLPNSLPDDICLFFDLNAINTSSIIWANFTLDYSSVDLAGNGIDPNNLVLYVFDLETESWVLAEDKLGITIIRETGRLIFVMPTNTLFAIGSITPTVPPSGGGGGGGGGGDDDKEAAIPGFDLYLLLGGIALLSVALIIKRKRIIKI